MATKALATSLASLAITTSSTLVTASSADAQATIDLRAKTPFDVTSIHEAKVSSSILVSKCLQFMYSKISEFSPDQVYILWLQVRAQVVAPAIQIAVMMCIVMSFMVVIEVMYMTVVSLAVKIVGWKPEKRYKWEPLKEDDELGSSTFPMVLVQIPMHNELEVYKLSIGSACALTWPRDRIIIQVLDDSTDPVVKDLIQQECKIWASKGINILYEYRDDRKGFKAGSLKKGMEYVYAQQCDFVAIFDADFQPDSDFLVRTIPFLVHNSDVALVQARWEYVNYDDCLVTRIQKISLDYHFQVEQESGSTAYSFFSFNGTAGVWRISTINEIGGWKDRTMVEDMDISVRATLKGWKFIYVGSIKVKGELPSTFEAYCKQQHRWTSGAANLFKKMACEIIMAKGVPLWKKIHLMYSFFFVRRLVTPVVAFIFYVILMPLSALIPEVHIPVWGAFYIPTTLLILNVIQNPTYVHMFPVWILFENVMSLHRMRAALNGMLGKNDLDQWVVTEKLGMSVKDLKSRYARLKHRVSFSQLGLAFFILCCATYSLVFGSKGLNIYLFLQALAFSSLGFGCFGFCTSFC